MKTAETPKDVLKTVLKLFRNGEGWIRGYSARAGRRGGVVSYDSPNATCFCLSGAVARACISEKGRYRMGLRKKVDRLLTKALPDKYKEEGTSYIGFNDERGRRFSDITALVQRALKLAA